MHTTRTLLASAAVLATMATGAAAEATLTGVLTDAADGNRFFTRLGGTAEDTLSYSGLEAGTSYVLTTVLIDPQTQEEVETVETPFTAQEAQGEITVTIPVPRNETDTNIDYVTRNTLRDAGGDTVIETTGEASNAERTIQVHSIQRLNLVSAVDSTDGDQRIDGQGGTIEATVAYENMVEGYPYTFWGQLLTPSGQAVGVFASIPEYAPETKAGEVTLNFEVPEGFDGISLIPSVGVYHKKRVEILDNGNIRWLEDAANPVMIASDTDLEDTTNAVEVGVPFGKTE